MSDEEDGGLEEQLRVAAEYGRGLLRLNEKLQQDNAALRLEIADGAAQYDARMRQQETTLVEPLQRRVEELEDTVSVHHIHALLPIHPLNLPHFRTCR